MGEGIAIGRVVLTGLLELAEQAPDIYEALVSGKPADELIRDAKAAGVDLEVRTGPDGTWGEDLGERLERG